MDNNTLVPSLILFFAAIVGISYFIASLIDKYSSKKQRKTDYTNGSSPKKDTTSKEQKPPEKDYSELNKEIEEVINWIGVSEPVNTSEMFVKVLDGKEKEVIGEIAEQLSLPMKITTKYSSEEKRNDDGSSTLAEVVVGNIPRYGSKYLKDYPCTITLYPGYNSRSDRFIYVIAHELCHYVLQSLRPRLSDNKKEERLTDLAVIFGGFESAYRTGWQSYTHGNAGYILDENDITYIRRRYESILAERRRKCEEISTGYKKLIREKSDLLLFIKRSEILLKHQNEKIAQDDMGAIGRCFSLINKNEIEKINKLLDSLEPFSKNKTRYGKMENEKNNLEELAKILRHIELPEMVDISVLMKYTDKYSD